MKVIRLISLLAAAAAPVQFAAAQSLAFERTGASFGTVCDTSGVQSLSYVFRNEGGSPVHLSQVAVSCPCISATFPKGGIAPGEKGTINLSFNPERMAGDVLHKAFVYTGGSSSPAAVLSLSGSVLVADSWSHLPAKAGTLRLRTAELTIPLGEKTARVLCANTGDEAIRPDIELLPQGVEAHFEPSVIEPGGEADLVIRAGSRNISGGFVIKAGRTSMTIFKITVE